MKIKTELSCVVPSTKYNITKLFEIICGEDIRFTNEYLNHFVSYCRSFGSVIDMPIKIQIINNTLVITSKNISQAHPDDFYRRFGSFTESEFMQSVGITTLDTDIVLKYALSSQFKNDSIEFNLCDFYDSNLLSLGYTKLEDFLEQNFYAFRQGIYDYSQENSTEYVTIFDIISTHMENLLVHGVGVPKNILVSSKLFSLMYITGTYFEKKEIIWESIHYLDHHVQF